MSSFKIGFLKLFFIANSLIYGPALLSQTITHLDSLDNEFDIKVKAMLGNDLSGQMIPYFIVEDKNGTISRDSLRSKVTFINLWFEACLPCIAEFQALERFYVTNKPRTGFQFISITFEPDSVIARVKKEKNLTYPIYHLSVDGCRQLISKMGYPVTLIIDKDLKIAYSTAGGSVNPDIADKHLNLFIQAELEKVLEKSFGRH